MRVRMRSKALAGAVSASVAAAALVAGASLAVPLWAQQIEPTNKAFVFASLDGEQVPDGGSEEGFADFSAEIDLATGEICYSLSVDGVEMTAAHIHKGKAGESGEPVVTLQETAERGQTCEEVNLSLAKAIGGKPENYYVNVHTAEFPGGALRGQLEE